MSDAAFSHIGLTCQDPVAMEKFYTRHFGFQRIRVVPLGEDQIVFIRSGNLVLELFTAKEERPVPQAVSDGPAYPGYRHLAFEVDDIHAKVKELGNDVTVNLGPFTFDDFIQGWAGVWVADPEGNVIELCQGFKEEDAPPALVG